MPPSQYDGVYTEYSLVTLRLLLVRHGLSSFNVENKIQGRDDASILTADGLQQAKRVGKAIKDLPISAIYSSPLKRAASTTNEIINQFDAPIEPIYHKGLLEIELSAWSGLTSEEVESQFPEKYLEWKVNPEELRLKRENGEEYKPISDLINQAHEFVNEIVQRHSSKENETVVLVAHNAILRCIIIDLLSKPNNLFRRLKINNASISVFNITIKIHTPPYNF